MSSNSHHGVGALYVHALEVLQLDCSECPSLATMKPFTGVRHLKE